MAYTVSRERIAPTQVINEGTPGTIESAAPATAGLLTYNSAVTMNANVNRIELRPHSASFTRQQDIMASRMWNLNFTTMMQGPGTLAEPGMSTVVGFKAFDALMKACAATSTYTNATNVVFTPSTIANSGKSATVYTNHNGKVYKAHGCLGNMVFKGNPRSGVEATFSGMGKYNVPTDLGSEFANWSGGTQRAQAFLGATGTIDNGASYTPVLKAFEFNLGVSVAPIDDVNSTNGFYGLFIADRNPTLNITIAADGDAGAGVDWDEFYTDWLSTVQTHNISIAYGSGTGNVIDFDFPTAQVVNVQAGVDGGLRVLNISYKVQHATAETEWTITIDSTI